MLLQLADGAARSPRRRSRHVETESEFDDWVAAATERADPFMAWLGVVFALLIGYGIAVDVGATTERVLEVLGWCIWAVFAIEFAAKVFLAPRRLRFIRTHWWQLGLLLLPFLRVLSFLRLARLGRALPASRVLSSSYRAVGTARYLLRSRLAFLGGVSTVIALAISELAFLFERDKAGAAFESFGDAVLWALAVVIALQADPVPVSTGARIVMITGFVAGLVVVASLAGVIGSYLVEERRERAAEESGA